MPLPRHEDADYISNRLLHEEMSYNTEDLTSEFHIRRQRDVRRQKSNLPYSKAIFANTLPASAK